MIVDSLLCSRSISPYSLTYFTSERATQKLDVVLRTPSPPESPGPEPTLWTSKTPSNPLEAIAQSDFIKNRVSSHQNSSPTSIHQAINQLAKGTQGIMHEVALLRAEVGELREANSTLSKRRKAKKKISPEWRIAYSTRCKGFSRSAASRRGTTRRKASQEGPAKARRNARAALWEVRHFRS